MKIENSLSPKERAYYSGYKRKKRTIQQIRHEYDKGYNWEQKKEAVNLFMTKGVEVSAGLEEFNDISSGKPTKEWIFSWASAKDARRTGLTSKMIQEAIKITESYMDDYMEKYPLTAYIDSTNVASIKTAEKNGFKDSKQSFKGEEGTIKRYVYSKH